MGLVTGMDIYMCILNFRRQDSLEHALYFLLRLVRELLYRKIVFHTMGTSVEAQLKCPYTFGLLCQHFLPTPEISYNIINIISFKETSEQ